jgi:hypothetical protein
MLFAPFLQLREVNQTPQSAVRQKAGSPYLDITKHCTPECPEMRPIWPEGF